MDNREVTMSVGASRDEIEDVLDGLRAGDDMTRLNSLRRQHGKCRADLLNLIWKMKDNAAEAARPLEDLLTENRIREDYINRSVDAVMDNRHAARMAELAETSNNIASAANLSAKALKFWTIVLAIATVVLAGATLALIWATLHA